MVRVLAASVALLCALAPSPASPRRMKEDESPIVVGDARTLAQVFIVTRHGVSTPFTSLQHVHVPWRSLPGSLTPSALREAYDLGSDLRKILVNGDGDLGDLTGGTADARWMGRAGQGQDLPPRAAAASSSPSYGGAGAAPAGAAGLLSANYTPGQLYVRSTNAERTIAHAQAVLLGLYPPGTGPDTLPVSFQPIPVHAPPDSDDVMLRAVDKCQALSHFLESVYLSERWRDKEESAQPTLARASAALGTNVTLRSMPLYGDFVASLVEQGLAGDMMGNATSQAVLSLYDWVESARLEGLQAGRVAAGVLLGQIVTDMRLRVSQRADAGPLANIFSVHPTNIMAVFSALGVPNTHVPQPGAHVTLELHGNSTAWPNTADEPRRSRAEEDFYVLVRRNGVPLSIPGCGAACRLDAFIDVVDSVTQTYAEWEKDCRPLAPPPTPTPHGNGSDPDEGGGVNLSGADFALISLGVALGGTLLGIAVGYICHKRSTIRVQKKYLRLVESGVLSY